MALRALPAQPRRRDARLSVRQAALLGLVQGPTEVLPVSSSGHLVLLPALMRWPYAQLDADVRKSFEVALHVGAGAALAWLLRDDLRAALARPAETAALVAPAALAGVALEPLIEQRLSDPRIAALGQVTGGVAMAWADANPRASTRYLLEGWVGIAQALALVPGVSRNGATLTAARALGLSRAAAVRMSWRAGLPVILGAGVLKGVRAAQRGLAPEMRAPFAAGAATAFASTLASAPLLRAAENTWAPLAAYRVALGAVALRRLHRLQWPRG
jgi:undecaprenyl-diphosphatase